MQILSVALKNFKAHADQAFHFSPGTNAICGENGAGKTSILEAIAWVLFDYQGDYRKADFIRNGSASAEVTVEFISSADGRVYLAQRHTTNGYVLFDPQLNQRLPYSRLKDEIKPWLREHLGVSPGTDLGELFARTVGVPQGTFTADFLQSPEHRRAVFDKVLKVEEYKTVHRDLNGLRRYAEAQVEAVERDIAHCEERLTAWDALLQRHQTLTQQIAQDETTLAQLHTTLQRLEADRTRLTAQAQQVQARQAQVQTLEQQRQALHQQQGLLQQQVSAAQQAERLCQQTQAAHDQYLQAEAALQQLAQAQTQRHQTQTRLQQLQKTLDNRAADLVRLQVELERLEAAIAEIATLQPQVQTQIQLETELRDYQQQQHTLAQAQGQLAALQRQQAQLAKTLLERRQALAALNALEEQVAQIPTLEADRDRLQQQISRIEAARQFEADLRRIIAGETTAGETLQAQTQAALQHLATLEAQGPGQHSAAVAALKTALAAGVHCHQSLLAQMQTILADITTQTDGTALGDRLQGVQQQLSTLYSHRSAIAHRPQQQQHLDALQQQQQQLAADIAALETQVAQGQSLTAAIATAQQRLATLQDPRGRCAQLEQARQQQPALQKRHQEMQAAQGGIQTQLSALEQQLHTWATLDADLATQQAHKARHQGDYQRYLQHQQTAQTRPQREAEFAALQQQQETLAQQLTTARTQLQTAQGDYDPQQLQTVNAAYEEAKSQRDRLLGSLPEQQRLRQNLDQQIAELKAVAERRDTAIAEKKQRDRIKRFINFARRTYKEAGPKITERYVLQVSREADRLFRELLNRPNVALTWTRDYDIQVQEGSHTRRFINLSGGEQMCAALAVRLALLKVLADIDIAFFDEPTTNMDRPRRQRLAEAIGRIKSFNQLFVISHDDTFETVTENVIFVERAD